MSHHRPPPASGILVAPNGTGSTATAAAEAAATTTTTTTTATDDGSSPLVVEQPSRPGAHTAAAPESNGNGGPRGRESEVRAALKAYVDAQSRREAIYAEYNDAFNEHLSATESSAPLEMREILRIVTEGLLECSHTLRTVQTELRAAPIAGSEAEAERLATLVGKTQDLENLRLRATVKRDQLRKVAQLEGRDETEEVKEQDDLRSQLTGELGELMDEVRAELAELPPFLHWETT